MMLKPKMTPEQLLDLYYHDLRSYLLEAAACLDRLQRAGGVPAKDLRLQRLRQAANVVLDEQPERARRFLEIMSE